MSKVLEALTLKKGEKWFSSHDRLAEEWDGPHKTIQEAILATWCDDADEIIYVSKGRKSTKEDREEFGVDYPWFIDSIETAIKIDLSDLKKLKNKPCCNHEKGEWSCPA